MVFMKKVFFVLVLLLASAQTVAAQTSITPRSNTQFAAPSPTPAVTVVTPVPTPVATTPTPAPVVAVVNGTTKGGLEAPSATTAAKMPVTGSVSQSLFLALSGLMAMGVGAYKTLKA